MKKIVYTLFIALVFVFSIAPAKAEDGGIPIGGKTCGIAGYPPCPIPAELPSDEDTYYKTVLDYLSQLFG